MADVFQTNGTDNFASGVVDVMVNGVSKNKLSAAGKTLGAFIREQARYYGLRTFSVYVDGRKLDTNDSIVNSQVSCKQLDLVAKDARGKQLGEFTYDPACSWEADDEVTEATASN